MSNTTDSNTPELVPSVPVPSDTDVEVKTPSNKSHGTDDIQDIRELENITRLSVKDLNNKLLGLIYGCVIGEMAGVVGGTWGYSSDQITIVMDTLAETGIFHVNTFLQKMQSYAAHGLPEFGDDHNNIDQYTKEVVSVYNDLSDISKTSFDQYSKYNVPDCKLSTCDNTSLIRCAMVGVYADWDSLSFAATIATHADHRCISAGVIISAAVRSMLIGRLTYVSTIINDTVSMILTMRKMTNKRDVDEYMRYTSEGYCSDLNLLNLGGGNVKHTYKCMTQAMNSLDKISKIKDTPAEAFKDIIKELQLRGGDVKSNSALSGAMMGCEIGYTNLPLDWLHNIEDRERVVLDKKVIGYIKKLGLASNESTFEDILIEYGDKSTLEISTSEISELELSRN